MPLCVPPELDWADRALLATLLAVMPKARRQGLRLLVTPDTILRWHRDIVRRRWADRDALSTFARTEPHRSVMRAIRPWMKDSVFRSWTTSVADLDNPARLWAGARTRIAAEDPAARGAADSG